MSNVLDWARRYIRAGYSLIPLNPHDKTPFTALLPTVATDDGAKHSWAPYQSRLPNPAVVEHWFSEFPNANVGIVTGSVSQLFVLDCDNEAAIRMVQRKGLPLNCPIVITGKGAHFYFKYPDFPVGNRAGLLEATDIRSDGGYVVAPPSIHPNKAIYHWAERPFRPAEAPKWLLRLLQPPPTQQRVQQRPPRPDLNLRGSKYGRAAMIAEQALLCTSSQGGRNDQLNRSAFNLGQLIADNLIDRPAVESMLLEASLYIGLGEVELLRTIKSGIDAGMANPRYTRAKAGV